MGDATIVGDLSESARGSGQANLLAGSAGYRHFLGKMAAFISPEEALETRAKFNAARKLFWLVIVAYALLYLAVNQSLGPVGLRATAWGNDLLRGALLFSAVWLARRVGIAVAAQLILPLASWCFLPMPVTSEPDWWKGPLLFGLIVSVLFASGWCIDLGANPRGRFAPLLRIIPFLGMSWFLLLTVVAALWIVDKSVPPLFSILAVLASSALLLLGKPHAPADTDVSYLYAAAWKRWRFFITGRLLAILFCSIPFLLFTNLIDHQGQLEACLDSNETPRILRWTSGDDQWNAFFWRHEGRFLNVDDLSIHADAPVIHAFYLVFPTDPQPADSPKIPPDCRGPAHDVKLPGFDDSMALQSEMKAMNTQRMTRPQFLEKIKNFEPLRIDSRCRLVRRDPGITSGFHILDVSFHDTGKDGVCFAEKPNFITYNPQQLQSAIKRINIPKWIFLAYGVLGFIFLWRRGGDSSLARWVGLWLMGASILPLLASSDDTLPHFHHWMWQQSVLYHWNTLASAGAPFFTLLFIAAVVVAMLWTLQLSASICWIHICWPTLIHPQYPVIVRHLLILGKIAAVVAVQLALFLIIAIAGSAFAPRQWDGVIIFVSFFALSTLLFLGAGWILRRFTSKSSEVPRLGALPIAALIALNASTLGFAPLLILTRSEAVPAGVVELGAVFGCTFIVLMTYLILKRDFLQVRAVDGFTTLLLLIFVPFAINRAEYFVPRILAGLPFFHERGSDLIAILCVLLIFPTVHHWLHELLLFISLPRLRKIEHTVEHALETIVDAHTLEERSRLVSELFETLRVPGYLFYSRGAQACFNADINKLDRDVPPVIELSPALRKFLGQRHRFVDLHTMAFEWRYFFHQFELHRIAQATGCRYLLPVSVGDSLRALLLIPEGPGESVMANPAVSAKINNFAIAAALSRPRT